MTTPLEDLFRTKPEALEFLKSLLYLESIQKRNAEYAVEKGRDDAPEMERLHAEARQDRYIFERSLKKRGWLEDKP